MSATIGAMTDEPTKSTSEPPAPPASPSEPSGVGFAAIRPPGQPSPQMPPSVPPSAYQQQPPPLPPPSPPGPAHAYDYSRIPPNRGGGGPSLILIGGLALVLVLVVGVGAMLAFNIGPFARPTPTPVGRPSPTTPLVTPSSRPSGTSASASASTSTPQASATASAGPTATPIPSGDVIAVLLSHIPSEIVDSCTTTTGEGKVLARAKCSARDGNIEVTYFLYGDHDSMFATYEGFRAASEIEPNSGNCNDPASWPAESDFAISGEPSGRFLCTEALGATTIYWTDNRLNILSEAADTESDHSRLVDFWVHDSGPNL